MSEPLAIDLAACPDSRKAPRWLGRGAEAGYTDALVWDSWHELIPAGQAGWLNPPYCDVRPWVRRASATGAAGAAVIGLFKAVSQATRWWREHVVSAGGRTVYLEERVVFEGRLSVGDPAPFGSVLVRWGPSLAGAPPTSR